MAQKVIPVGDDLVPPDSLHDVVDNVNTMGEAIGETTDAPASGTVPEDATARTGISLWKGIKNAVLDVITAIGNIYTSLGLQADAAATAGDVGTVQAKLRRVTAQLNGGLPAALGAQLANASLSVVMASNQYGFAMPATIIHGQTTVAVPGTEVTLGAAAALTRGIWVKALGTNTGLVFVGVNPVTSATGYQLYAGQAVFLEVADRATMFIDAAVGGEGVCYVGS